MSNEPAEVLGVPVTSDHDHDHDLAGSRWWKGSDGRIDVVVVEQPDASSVAVRWLVTVELRDERTGRVRAFDATGASYDEALAALHRQLA